MSAASDHDYYCALGVPSTASRDEITRAFRRLAMRWHPDRNPGRGAQAEDIFKRVQRAYAVLKDAEKRAAYDKGLAEAARSHDHSQGHGAGPASDSHPPVRGPDYVCESTIPLEIAIGGGPATARVRASFPCLHCCGQGGAIAHCGACDGNGTFTRGMFKRQRRCAACRGTGETASTCHACGGAGAIHVDKTFRVTVGPGVRDGTVLRARGQGGAGMHGGASGDLLCTLRIRRDRTYTVDGLHLRRDLKVSFITACLGGRVPVRRFHQPLSVVIPPLTRAGHVITVAGGGLQDQAARRTGDLLMHVVIDLPPGLRYLDEDQRSLLRALARGR